MNEQDTMPNAFEILPLEEVVPGEAAPFDAMAVGEKMAQETAVFELHIRRPGFTKPIPPDTFIRKIKEAGEEALTEQQAKILEQYRATIVRTAGPDGEQTDTTMLHISQDIIDRREIAKIVNHDDKFSAWIKAQSIPSPMLAAGMYQIRLHRTEEIDAAVEAFVLKRKQLINAFRDAYYELKEQAKKRRWPFYDENDYPSWAVIESKYRVEARYLSFNVPAALQRINSQIYEREKAKVKLQWADAAQEARDAQRIALQGLLDHYVTMLGRDEKGKRRTFRPSAVKKLQEFLTMFDEINITGDAELETVVKNIREVIGGVELETLKKDVSLRDTMELAVSKLKEQAGSLVVVRERKVVFDDEEPATTEAVDETPDDALPLN